MKKRGKLLKFISFIYHLILPIFDLRQLLFSFPGYASFLKDKWKYERMNGAEKINFFDIQPCIHDKTETTRFDTHYFYQDIWAFKKIYDSKVENHVDIGSKIDFVGFLSAVTNVTFIDIRPIETNIKNLKSVKGDILSLPLEDNSVSSLSCLHVAEHIGIGRYGDPLEPFGTKKACGELSRVLAKNGTLYFSLPIGKPKICFNAHRIHSIEQIIQYFGNLQLAEFSGINDQGVFMENIDINTFKDADYACGLFRFKKTAVSC